MRKCKFNKKVHCGYHECWDGCPQFKSSGQQRLMAKPVQVVKKTEKKGVKTTFYKVEK